MPADGRWDLIRLVKG